MKLFTTFLLVGLLALWMGFPSAAESDLPTGRIIFEKPGQCPLAACYCPNYIRHCRNDYKCPQNQKCCLICCIWKCVDPMEEVLGLRLPN